jgi:hypothetical protein
MKQLFFLLFVGFLLAGCAEQIKISHDFDSNADFASYKTYDLAPNIDSMQINDMNKRRLKAALSREMEVLGFTRDTENPDLVVNTNLLLEEKQSATAYNDYYGGWGYYGGFYPYGYGMGFSTTTIDINTYVQGTLFIDLIDWQKKQLVWQGRGTKTIVSNPKDPEERINDAVYRIMSQYPPVPEQ